MSRLVGHPLLHAREADELEGLGHERTDRAAGPADDLQRVGDVLLDRLVGQQPEVLEDRADLATQLRHLALRHLAKVVAADEQPAGADDLLADRQAHQGGLAGAAGADDEDELTAVDVEVDPVERGVALVGISLGDVLKTDHQVLGALRGRRG